MARGGQILDCRLSLETDAAQDAAVTAGRDEATRPHITLLNVSPCENLLLLDQHHAEMIPAVFVRPHARRDEGDGVDEILRSIAADQAVRALGGIATHGERGVE